ncbi:MAG: hypothetical protein KBD16_01020 [Candidatus Pacebacteria bacterium]|nr:hypothetical protein [Candidatus Paceibacterota bacterium]
MNTELIGKIAAAVVVVSIIPYAIQVWRRKIVPSLTSWSLWTLIGLALLLTYKSAGATDSVLLYVFGFINPLVISILALWRGTREPLKLWPDVWCIAISIASLLLWLVVRGEDAQFLKLTALGLAILADAFAAIPTVLGAWRRPEEDRPFAWVTFALANGLNLLAVSEPSFSGYVLPAYMFITPVVVFLPLIRYRLAEKTPWSEWI